MSISPTSPREVQALYESLRVIRKGSEDDFELRSSDDGKLWGVRMFDDNPATPTLVLYAGPDAKELACDAADFDVDDSDDSDDAE